MRIAVVSDIHGNLTALEAVLLDLRTTTPDLIVHAGDLVVNGSSPAEVVDIVRDSGWPGVHGNTDEMLWRPDRLQELASRAPARHRLREVLFRDMAPAAIAAIGEERLQWLKALPSRWLNHDLAVVHAAPDDLWRAPLATASDEELLETYGVLQRPRVVYGHIHQPYTRVLPSLFVGNGGSVSLSYDGDPRAAYLVLDDEGASIRRVEYDIEQEVGRLQDVKHPFTDWLTDILRTGRFKSPPPG